ncbi:MAG: PD40 domain-containing protein [Deltaproteobacteria bacterium]|nr:PD40 domain-containing protein [Deltaproteobacteria bacterium]
MDGGGGLGSDASAPATLVRLEITPAAAELVSRDGAAATQTFAATGVFSDASSRPMAARFSVDPLQLGSIRETTGVFTANGYFGGTAIVRATAREGAIELSAEATLRVRLERSVFAAGTASSAPTLFAPAPLTDPARAPSLVYPLDGAVMPDNVFPPDIQWENGAPGDVIRVSMQKPNTTINAYVTMGSAADAHWLADENAWRRITRSDPEAPAIIELTRYEASTGAVIGDRPISIRFARASLAGTIYYWDIEAGRIVRIDDGTAQRQQFMPTPPLDCVGCHSVSASGRYMAGRFGGGDNIAGVLDLTQDLTGNPPPTAFPVDANSIRWWFSSWSPNDRRLIVSTDETGTRALRLVDPFQGVYLPTAGEPLPTSATHPAWSPDGTAIAFIGGIDQWGGDNRTGNVSILAVTATDTFGAAQTLHDGAAPGTVPAGTADSYPTWTPDSQWIAFAHGDSSRSETGHAALYLMKRDGSGLVRLDKASGGPAAQDTFQPRMSPFRQGGYYWVTYLSRRDYGNSTAGTKGSTRQQIWISAIKENPVAGEDPSEIGYWLPGQNTASRNISAYWAPRACREAAASCQVGSECCSGDCRPDANNNLVCSPGAPQSCGEFGAACVEDADCCDGAPCVTEMCGGGV